MSVYDLIYCEDHAEYKAYQEAIKNRFPDAVLEDGSDFIHPHRFSVNTDADPDDWRLWLIEQGMALQSIDFNMLLHQNTSHARELMDRAGVPAIE